MFEDIEFVSEDELRKPIPQGTVARVQIRADREGVLGDFKTGESKFGPWVLLPFEVTEGEHRGSWASMMLSVSGKDRKFRRVFQNVTGVDLSEGGSVSFSDFTEKLVTGVFEAKLGPEKRQGAETGYTTVVELGERVGERQGGEDAGTGGRIETTAEPVGVGGSDEDIPF